MKVIFYTFSLGFLCLLAACRAPAVTSCDSPVYPKMKGLSMVAQPDSFKFDPMPAVQAVHANWITVIPYGFTPPEKPEVSYNTSEWQWWGERPIGVQTTIRLAKAANLKVMLKPQLWIHNSWVGHLNYDKNSDWEQWEADYTKFILQMADIAAAEKVDLFCIGTEFEIHAVQRPQYWKTLIKTIRSRYAGQLTYAANWDNFEQIKFWNDLDFIGINAYFPLINDKTPSVPALKKAWQKPFDKIAALYCATQKPILFTEFGYLSVDGTAHNTWELEDNLKSLAVNETAQNNALEALFDTFWQENWWAGGFLWKWYPDNKSHEGHYGKGYTPQGKAAEKCLQKWYGGSGLTR